MPISVSCLCGRSMRIRDEHAGKKIRCPACSSTISVLLPQAHAEVIEEAIPVAIVDEPSPIRAGRPLDQDEPLTLAPVVDIPKQRFSDVSSSRRRRLRERPLLSNNAHQGGWFGNINAGAAGGAAM